MMQTSPHHYKTLDARCQGAPAVQVDPVAVIQVLQRELPQAREEAGRIRGQYLRLARELRRPRNQPRRAALDSQGADLQPPSASPVRDGVAPIADLTAREAEVLFCIGKGKTDEDAGQILNTSLSTLTKHLASVIESWVSTTAAAHTARQQRRAGGHASRHMAPESTTPDRDG